MKTRTDIAVVRQHLGMFVPKATFHSVAAFFVGAQWAEPEFLPHIQAFVSVRLGGENLGWPWGALRHAVTEASYREVLAASASDVVEAEAIEALFNAIDAYFSCVEGGEIEVVCAEFESRLS